MARNRREKKENNNAGWNSERVGRKRHGCTLVLIVAMAGGVACGGRVMDGAALRPSHCKHERRAVKAGNTPHRMGGTMLEYPTPGSSTLRRPEHSTTCSRDGGWWKGNVADVHMTLLNMIHPSPSWYPFSCPSRVGHCADGP